MHNPTSSLKISKRPVAMGTTHTPVTLRITRKDPAMQKCEVSKLKKTYQKLSLKSFSNLVTTAQPSFPCRVVRNTCIMDWEQRSRSSNLAHIGNPESLTRASMSRVSSRGVFPENYSWMSLAVSVLYFSTAVAQGQKWCSYQTTLQDGRLSDNWHRRISIQPNT